MDYGLSRIIMDCHGLSWMIIHYHGLWIIVDYGSGSESPPLPSRAQSWSDWCVVSVSFPRPYGALMFCCLDAYSIGLNIHRASGILMEYVWNMYGIRMDYSWNMHGIRMGYAWNMHEYERYMHGVCDVWDMHGICMGSAWNILEICMEYERDMYGTSMNYAWNMHGICMERVWWNILE
jgi:hypothetical protein